MNSLGRGDDKKDKNKASVITRETIGMTLLLFGALLFFIAVTSPYLFGDPGAAITSFFIGVFGFFFYPLDILLVYLGVTMVIGKKPVSGKWLARGLFFVLCIFFLVHIATAEKYFVGGYGNYLKGCWQAATGSGGAGTGGGVVLGIIAYPFRLLLSAPGAYVIFSLLTLFSVFLILMGTPLKKHIKGAFKNRGRREIEETVKPKEEKEPSRAVGFDDLSVPAYHRAETEEMRAPEEPVPAYAPARRIVNSAKDESREILFSGDPASSYRNNLIFNSDSQFNTYPRRSSVAVQSQSETPVYEAPRPSYTAYESPKPDYGATASPYANNKSVSPEEGEQTDSRSMSYSQRYLTETETPRPAMPRKITPERPVAEEASFTPAPSYRAPSAPSRGNDFYANDVLPEKDEEEIPAADENATPLERYASRAASAPKEESEELPSSRTSEELFRSIFSRPVEKTEPQENTAARSFRDYAPAPAPQEEPSRRETRFGFGLDESSAQDEDRSFDAPSRTSAANLFDDSDADFDDADYREEPDEEALPSRTTRSFTGDRMRGGMRERNLRGDTRASDFAPMPAEPAPSPKKHIYRPYRRPSPELFARYDDTVSVPQEEIERNSAIIVETLAGFRVDAEVVNVRSGSTVTRYDIDIPKNIAVRTVIKRDAEIAMRLHARDGVNIYSNAKEGLISIEVPNSKRATVGLRSVLMAEEYVNAKPNSLMFAIGKDIEGSNVCGNIVKMKHILVAGSTGSGKSVCLNAMLISLICRYSPAELRLILIDPKKVEFTIFDGLPHLMINEIISDAQKAVTALNWAIKEMERRYLLFEQKTRSGINVHNLDEYNAGLNEDEERLPKIVIVVDELADLMSVAKKDIEDRIQRLAQKARAAGMHLVIATQRPSVDVITGVIKGNLPTRLAFRVIQEVDSRTILDESGAEKLLGNGDMLYRTEGMFNCLRVQGAFLSSAEVQAVIEDIKANNEAYFDDSVADYINKTGASEGGGSYDSDDDGTVDPQYIKALAIVVKLGSASISLIQRKCSVGYNHAGKIMEWMELMGYVSPFDGKAKARTVLLTKEEFESKYGSID